MSNDKERLQEFVAWQRKVDLKPKIGTRFAQWKAAYAAGRAAGMEEAAAICEQEGAQGNPVKRYMCHDFSQAIREAAK